jgi:hypothetical protein
MMLCLVRERNLRIGHYDRLPQLPISKAPRFPVRPEFWEHRLVALPRTALHPQPIARRDKKPGSGNSSHPNGNAPFTTDSGCAAATLISNMAFIWNAICAQGCEQAVR